MSFPTSNHIQDRSRRFPLRRQRRTLRGFTLIELMAVVVIVGILATIAVPGAANRFRENRSQQAANEIATLYRNARMRAMGRGSAVLVRWQAATETFQVLEAIQGQGAAGAVACATQPASQCRNPLTRWQPGDASTQLFQNLGGFSADNLGAHTTTVTVDGTNVANLDICFSPMGTAFFAQQTLTDNAALLQPMGQIPVVQVRRDTNIGLTRRVLFLPNGTARVVAQDPG